MGTFLLSLVAAAGARCAPQLSQADADAWLDGFVPSSLAHGDIAGAVVVIVKDGAVLTQRGFGYADIAARKKADPATSLFRVGSTSKLFTWTAVMQLVEQGKIDLDVDVNRYLDFAIPPYHGKPITMRNIMTHTSGFEEAFKGGITFSGQVKPLGTVLKQMLPARVYEPGSTPAYSNYATGVAGYIVERVSGMPFEDYIEHNIFQPLGMNHSSFRQPLPALLAGDMAQGYPKASVEPKPFELISVPPAGSLAMSGADAAKFMISHLNHGAGLLKPLTADLMHTPAYGAIQGLNRMALGFYEQQMNDFDTIAHGGDLFYFHGDLWLFPEQNVGLLIEMNSAGEGASTATIRQMLFEQFSDRYFPATDVRPLVELASAKEHALMLAGSYITSRSSFTNFIDINNLLSQTKIGIDAQGRPLVPELFGGPSRTWIEVSPFAWRDALGHARLGAKVENGRVVRWSVNEISPFMVYDRAPWYRDAAWLLPASVVAMFLVLVAALLWPISALTQRHWRRRGAMIVPNERWQLPDRGFAIFAWVVIAAICGWALTLAHLESGVADGTLWLLEIIGTIGFVGLPIAAIWKLSTSWQLKRNGNAKVWALLLLGASCQLLWVAFGFHLISFGARY